MSTSNFDKFRGGLIVLAVLVICFEGTVSLLPVNFRPDVAESTGMRLKNDHALHPGDLDVVILGDCFFYAGIIPPLLDKKLNVHSFNFATNRVQTYLISYLLFKRVIEHTTRTPRLVILGVHATSLYFPLKLDIEVLKTAILPSFGAPQDLLNELPLTLRAQVALHQALIHIPSLKMQYFLRNNWLHYIFENDKSRYMKIEESIIENKGYVNEDLLRPTTKIRINSDLKKENVAIQEFNNYYINKILNLALQSGVKVVIVTNSYGEDFSSHMGYDINFDLRYFNALQRLYPNVIGVLDMHHAVKDPDRYADIHLDYQGATEFTEELTRRLKTLPWQ